METQAEGPQTPFEVFCHHCKVSFPIGARQCIHCGGRLGRQRFRPSAPAPPQPMEQMDVGEEGLPRRGILSPLTAVWLLLAMAGAMYRACTAP